MPVETRTIYQIFQSFSWNNFLEIDERQNQIKIMWTDEFIIKKEKDFLRIQFYDYNKETRKIEKKKDYLDLFIHKDLNPLEYINHWEVEDKDSYGYNFSREYSIFRKIFIKIDSVKISDKYKKDLQVKENQLLIKSAKMKEIFESIEKTNKKANSSRNSLLNHLINKSKFEFLNKTTKSTTSIVKWDFEFLIHRLNLATKETKKDFQKYLNQEDISSLSNLFDLMLRKEIFDEEYIRKLDNYFIKEKLEDIIKMGKEILELKVESVETKEAKKIIKKVFNEDIWQLETLWQRYFERYLLYLFFSYKKIVPKVELNNLENLDKQYPDFIGVNHYDGVDIIEIKTHLKNTLIRDNSHKNFAFSPEMSKSIIQTINYMDAITDNKFKKSKEKKDLLNYLNIDENLHRPKGIIIISSKEKICKNQTKLTPDQKERLKKDFTKLRNSIQNIQIFTFDEILGIAEKYIENINYN